MLNIHGEKEEHFTEEKPTIIMENEYDIKYIPIRRLVESNFIAKPGGMISKDTLDLIMKSDEYTTQFMEVTDPRLKHALYTCVVKAMENVFKISNVIVTGDKDHLHNIEVINDSVEKFIEHCCIIDKNVFEKILDMNGAYKEFCLSHNNFALNLQQFPAKMKYLGYNRVNKCYEGIYLKINSIRKFIDERCELDSVENKYGVPLSQFIRGYNAYCLEKGFNSYDNKEVFIIITAFGFEYDEIDKGSKDILGICIRGEPYDREGREWVDGKSIKKGSIKNKNKPDFDVDDFIHNNIVIARKGSIAVDVLSNKIKSYYNQPKANDDTKAFALAVKAKLNLNINKYEGIEGASILPPENNPLMIFIKEHCIINENLRVMTKILCDEYKIKMKKSNLRLTKELGVLGFEATGDSHAKIIHGIFPKDNIIEMFLTAHTTRDSKAAMSLLELKRSFLENYPKKDGREMNMVFSEYLIYREYKLDNTTAYGIRLNNIKN